jgi:hypothetical protein
MAGLRQRYQQARASLDRAWGYVLFAACVILIVFLALVEFGFYTPSAGNPFGYLAIIAALIFVLSEYVAGFHKRLSDSVSAESAKVDSKVEQLRSELARLRSEAGRLTDAVTQGGKLFRLEGIVDDLRLRLKELRPGEALEIEHLGLDMTTAWEKICGPLEDAAMVARVQYRLLMLGKNERGVALPREVADWIGPACDQRVKTIEALEEIKAAAAEPLDGHPRPGSLDFEVRAYCEVPVVHGILVRRPFKAAYVAISRWSGRNYRSYYWGGDHYHRVVEPISSADQDLIDILDGYFHRWWNDNPPVSPNSR